MLSVIKQEIKSIQDRDPAAKSAFDVVLSYPGFHAIIFHRFCHWLWDYFDLRFLPRWISQISRFLTGIEIHPGAKIGENLFIDHGMGVVIGETATIGDNVTIYHGVTLGGVAAIEDIRHPQVGDDVIIGAGAQLLGPINIGDGARIGSNAVVVGHVPVNATMVGVPARNVSKECKADKSEFAAYGMTELPDIVMNNFDKMNKRIAELEQELAKSAKTWEGSKPKKAVKKTTKKAS